MSKPKLGAVMISSPASILGSEWSSWKKFLTMFLNDQDDDGLSVGGKDMLVVSLDIPTCCLKLMELLTGGGGGEANWFFLNFL